MRFSVAGQQKQNEILCVFGQVVVKLKKQTNWSGLPQLSLPEENNWLTKL